MGVKVTACCLSLSFPWWEAGYFLVWGPMSSLFRASQDSGASAVHRLLVTPLCPTQASPLRNPAQVRRGRTLSGLGRKDSVTHVVPGSAAGCGRFFKSHENVIGM